MIIYLQSTSKRVAAAGAAETLQWSSNTKNGNLIVVGANSTFNTAGVLTSVTDNVGNTYTQIDLDSAHDGASAIYYAKNTSGGTTPTVTFNTSHGGAQMCFWIREYSGASLTNPFDRFNRTNDNSFTNLNMSTTTGVIDTYSELVVAFASVPNTTGSTFTPSGGLTNEQKQTASQPQFDVADVVVTGFGAITATTTIGVAAAWSMTAATFRAASATKRTPLRPHAFSPGLAR